MMKPYNIHSEVWPVPVDAYLTPFEGIPMQATMMGVGLATPTMGAVDKDRIEQAQQRSERMERTAGDVSMVTGTAADVATDIGSIFGTFGIGPSQPPVETGSVAIAPRSSIPTWVPYAAGAVLLLGLVYFATRS